MLTCNGNAITEVILLKHLVWNVIIPLALNSILSSLDKTHLSHYKRLLKNFFMWYH